MVKSERARHCKAISQLPGCSGPDPSITLKQEWAQKTWEFEPVHLLQPPLASSSGVVEGRRGQALLQLPLKHVDVAIHLPPAIKLSATGAGGLDCRLQLLGMSATWPAIRTQGGSSVQVQPATSPALGFLQRCAALVLAHALFPEHTQELLGWLAVPVAAADALALTAAIVPASARHAAAQGTTRLRHQLRRRHSSGGVIEQQGIGWVDALGGVAAGTLHMVRCLSGPAAALASAGWLWSLLHPSSHSLCSCMVALAAVSAEYSQLSKDISRGKIRPGRTAEVAWRARHKAAAQRLSGYLCDLERVPPLQPLLQAANCCSIAAGVAVNGQGLSGCIAGSGISTVPAAASDAPVLGGQGVQLLLSASVGVQSDASKRCLNEASGLSRSQLLELFTGSPTEPVAVATKPPAAACQAVHPRNNNSSSSSSSNISSKRKPPTAPPAPAVSSSDALEAGLCWLPAPAKQPSEHLLPRRPLVQVSPTFELPSPAPSEPSSDVVEWQPLPSSSPSTSASTQPSSSAAPAPAAAAPENAAGAGNGQVCSSMPAADPLAFLDELPLYGHQDHKGAMAAALGVQPSPEDSSLAMRLQLTSRAVYLLLVFAPFLLLGVPMLLIAWYLLSRATQQRRPLQPPPPQQQQQQQQRRPGGVVVGTSQLGDGHTNNSSNSSSSSNNRSFNLNWKAAAAAIAHAVQHPQQLLLLLSRLCALIDLMLILLLGGHWAAGLDAWESAGLFLRRQAWLLLRFSCSNAGAAFIKWSQWSSSRRDIFPEDFCDVLAMLHDRAPVHSFRWTRKLVQQSFGVKLEEMFESFDPKPLASGSIAQVHKATLRSSSYLHLPGNPVVPVESTDSSSEERVVVVVKVCHPNVSHHIRLDFRLLQALSAAASQLPLLRGLSIRESVAQFSHTMTAQTDLRVEAVHALRFYNNFTGVSSSICVPRPIPGLVSELVLVETFEEGRSVAAFMKQQTNISTHIVALGVDAYLHMLLKDNWIHSDLHPGNILFRQRESLQCKAVKQQRQQQQVQKQQEGTHSKLGGNRVRRLLPWLRRHDHMQGNGATPGTPAGPVGSTAAPAQWEVELEQMINQQQSNWRRRHGNSSSSSSERVPGTAAAGHVSGHGDEGQDAGHLAQLVLLDFGLAEELTPEVRHHFVSFLNAIGAGDGLQAARHLLRWSHHQSCEDRHAFMSDVMDLFEREADIQSEAGIDLDTVMKECLRLARKHGVSIDSCYASLVIGVCVIVGFAKALDPAVNLMDAAVPTLLAYAMTGKVVGRLYS